VKTPAELRADAVAIWTAGVEAVKPAPLVEAAVRELLPELATARRILVVGGGKAGAGMAVGLETALADRLRQVDGLLNVPEGTSTTLSRVRLNAARPAGHNFPTRAGVVGVEWMLEQLRAAGPDDVALCLLSGGGSALLPAPAPGLTLEDKQAVTAALHKSGATIAEMNAVRKHLSAVKGGWLAEAFRGRRLISLIISDVVGDPLNVIASGPTAPDPTTYADALAVLDRYGVAAPPAVADHLRRGAAGDLPETPKALPATVENRVIGNNRDALNAAYDTAVRLGYSTSVRDMPLTGEAAAVGRMPLATQPAHSRGYCVAHLPICYLAGGETTVTLGPNPGKGGRNQELVLAGMVALGDAGMDGVCILSGGTDGEDGPTDAAGAVATLDTWQRAKGLDPAGHLARHDAYPLFDRCGGLLRTGLTGTNVMDIQVLLVT
jgi:hydroxypyruvate reductase/glycerate 2-kinase